MDAEEATLEGGWASTHPKTVGWLILVGLHAVFAVGPYELAALAFSTESPALSPWLMLGQWSGLKHDAVPFLIGLVQFFYVVPAILLALKLHYPAVAKGMLHGAVTLFLLNLSACGYFAWQLSKIEG